MDARPWRNTEPDLGLAQTLPFNSRQLAALLQTRPENLVQLARGTSSKETVVQPPIFFPFD
jgi:acyl carrier protein phosphodiesterase